MKLNEKLKSYLIIILYLIIGLLIVGTVQLLKTPVWLNSAYIALLLFVVVNFVTVRVFQLNSKIRIFWSAKKIYYLPVAILIGGFIATSPILVGLLFGKTTVSEFTLGTTFTISSIVATLAIVAWEELWFRGIFLNQCNKHLSEINISVTIGLLFMLVHLMNPEFDLLRTGPTLFFAGAFLTIIYFYFKTIWVSIGLHFGNNYLTLESNLDSHWFLGNEGYLGAIILALLFILFAKLSLNNTKLAT